MEVVDMRRRHLLALSAMVVPNVARAAWPDRPLRIVVPFPPGGAPDILARLLAPELAAQLGQPCVVENRSGASGMIGTEAVARAEADGHTLMMGSVATHAMVPNTFRRVPYDALRDFTPLGLVAETPNVVVVNPAMPARTLRDLVALARAQPGRLTFGSTSQGGTPHMSGELLKIRMGIEMNHVPYRGSGPMMADLLGGHVTVAFDNLPGSMANIRAGTIRALAVTTARRSPAMPDLPTFQEEGVPDFDVSSWFAMFAPARLPAEIAARLNTHINTLIQRPDLRERLLQMGASPAPGTPQALEAKVASELALWREVVRAAGIEPQ
jgi:tripartite-type tricarboxylate transporter receptor subunit TctC